MPLIDDITAGLLQERLAGTRLPDDPSDVTLPPESAKWPDDLREQLCQGLAPACVLVPVIERERCLTVLLTERSAELKHHAGQISFPGGRMEECDDDIGATALRETHEEVGIAPPHVSVLGYLDPMPTISGYAVTPVVGLVSPTVELRLERKEVRSAFEVPLNFLLNRRNARAAERDVRGVKIAVTEFLYERRRIWGATAHILIQLRKKLLNH